MGYLIQNFCAYTDLYKQLTAYLSNFEISKIFISNLFLIYFIIIVVALEKDRIATGRNVA